MSGVGVKLPIIVHTPGVCGGSARINGTRIPVWCVEECLRRGMTTKQITRDYPSLTIEGVQAATDYAAAHGNEIDRDIHENETAWIGPEPLDDVGE